MQGIIDENGLHSDHHLLLILLKEMGGEASLKDYVVAVWRKGWYRWDFEGYPGLIKDVMVSPHSDELAKDLEYLEEKGLIEITKNKIKLKDDYIKNN